MTLRRVFPLILVAGATTVALSSTKRLKAGVVLCGSGARIGVLKAKDEV